MMAEVQLQCSRNTSTSKLFQGPHISLKEKDRARGTTHLRFLTLHLRQEMMFHL